jgi:hypothetical protein
MAATAAAPHSTLGALEIGVIIGLFLFGIVTAQVSIYYQRFPEDPLHIKGLVSVWSDHHSTSAQRRTGRSRLVSAHHFLPSLTLLRCRATGVLMLATPY